MLASSKSCRSHVPHLESLQHHNLGVEDKPSPSDALIQGGLGYQGVDYTPNITIF